MNVEGQTLFYRPLPCVQSIQNIPSALFPSSFDIRRSIFCGSLSLLPTAVGERVFRFPPGLPRSGSQLASYLSLHGDKPVEAEGGKKPAMPQMPRLFFHDPDGAKVDRCESTVGDQRERTKCRRTTCVVVTAVTAARGSGKRPADAGVYEPVAAWSSVPAPWANSPVAERGEPGVRAAGVHPALAGVLVETERHRTNSGWRCERGSPKLPSAYVRLSRNGRRSPSHVSLERPRLPMSDFVAKAVVVGKNTCVNLL